MLQHAQIQVAGKPPIEVMFNPTQYALAAAASVQDKQVIGLADITQFTGGVSRTLGLDLLFDTYESGSDVREHTERVYALLELDPGQPRPPLVTFAWGSFTFTGWVVEVSGQFTLFFGSGVPARATLTVSFKEHVAPEVTSATTRRGSAGDPGTYSVGSGDDLAAIAAAVYGDARAWRPIAQANAIDNPRVLAPGRRLSIPPPGPPKASP